MRPLLPVSPPETLPEEWKAVARHMMIAWDPSLPMFSPMPMEKGETLVLRRPS